MSVAPQADREAQSFAETSLRLGGKTEEEVRRTGAVDRADEQVETLYAARHYFGMAVIDPQVAGLSSVHGCIGAVDPLRTFGTPEQKQRFLPRLASGETPSGFALTEPCAGSDLTALRTTAVEAGDHFEITGEKLFITHCLPGRTIGLVAMLKGQPAVLIAELPPHETDEFQIVPYKLHALRRGYN